jgi:hypothetical protein
MKILYISVLGMAAISLASAGQIEIGAGNSTGITTTGLTAAYINSITQPGNGGEHAYAGTLFASVQNITGSTLNGVAKTSAVGTGGTSTTPTSQNGFQQFTDPNNGVTFGLLADSAHTTSNFWSSSSGTGSSTIDVPVNVSGAYDASILLNDYWGVSGSTSQTDTVEFFFSGGATDTFTLTNGNQIQGSVQCSSAQTGGITTPVCTTYAQSTTSPNTDTAWGASYSGDTSTLTNFFGTSGTLTLSDLSFDISAFSGDVLQTIAISDSNNGNGSSWLALSAVTVTTPEPSTVLLLLTGLGILGYFGHRRKARL